MGAGAAVAVPVVLYLLSLWALQHPWRAVGHGSAWLLPGVAVLVLLSVLTGQAVVVTGGLLAGLLAVKLVRQQAVASRTAEHVGKGGTLRELVDQEELTVWRSRRIERER